MKDVLIILAVIIVVAIIVTVVVGEAIRQLRIRCERGEADPAMCKLAEIGGLFAEETPADDANTSP